MGQNGGFNLVGSCKTSGALLHRPKGKMHGMAGCDGCKVHVGAKLADAPRNLRPSFLTFSAFGVTRVTQTTVRQVGLCALVHNFPHFCLTPKNKYIYIYIMLLKLLLDGW